MIFRQCSPTSPKNPLPHLCMERGGFSGSECVCGSVCMYARCWICTKPSTFGTDSYRNHSPNAFSVLEPRLITHWNRTPPADPVLGPVQWEEKKAHVWGQQSCFGITFWKQDAFLVAVGLFSPVVTHISRSDRFSLGPVEEKGIFNPPRAWSMRLLRSVETLIPVISGSCFKADSSRHSHTKALSQSGSPLQLYTSKTKKTHLQAQRISLTLAAEYIWLAKGATVSLTNKEPEKLVILFRTMALLQIIFFAFRRKYTEAFISSKVNFGNLTHLYDKVAKLRQKKFTCIFICHTVNDHCWLDRGQCPYLTLKLTLPGKFLMCELV